jgi:hypothetical protein
MKRMAVLGLVWIVAASLASAAPLQREHVPADSKWVFHIDFQALRASSPAEKLREDQPQAVRRAFDFLREEYGIQPRQDLHGLTAFSDTYEEHSGAAILYAMYDRDKVQAKIGEQSAVESKWEGHTLYTWSIQDGKGEDHPITVILVDGETTVFASSPERAKDAVLLLEGKGESLAGKSSRLATTLGESAVPEGAAIYGAAIDLGEITRHEHFFPILRQHDRVVWTFGEQDGAVFETATFVGQSEEVAQEMEKLLHGATALFKLWAGERENLASIAGDTRISREGNTVKTTWRTGADTVLGAIEEFKQMRRNRP